jgi:hypothetical protein
MDQEIARNESRELVKYDFGDDEGVGVQGQDRDELKIPFLVLLQDLSPQVTGTKGKKVEGARAGLLYNTITDELFEALEFIPAHSEHVFVEWRANRGGLVGRHEKDSEFVRAVMAKNERKFGKLLVDPDKQKESNELIETFYVYGVIGSTLEYVVLSLTSTKIDPWKTWNTKAHMCMVENSAGRRVNPPRFAHRVKVSVGAREEKNGGSYFPIKIDPAEGNMKASLMSPEDPRYQAAKGLREMVMTGRAVATEEAPVAESDDSRGEF